MAEAFAPPVVILPSGGLPVTYAQAHAFATPFTVVTNPAIGMPVTLVADGGLPVKLLNPDGSPYVP